MKIKYFIAAFLFVLTTYSYGQIQKDIRLNFGLQWNLPERYFDKDLSKFNNENSGVGFHIYPKWYYNENLSFGLNIEYAIVEEKPITDDIGVFNILSFSPTANYYLTKNKVRPYIGLGIGIYTVSTAKRKLSTGIRPLIGVSVYNRFDLSFEYSKIFEDLDIDPNISKGFGNHYVSLKGSYSIKLFKAKKQ
ncbi:MAG: hypothetical protein ACK5NB_04005 [Flavobacteriaceae bacterium]